MKTVILIFTLLGLTFAFQNCSQPSSQVVFSDKVLTLLNSQNGQPFDGKIYLLIGSQCPDMTNIRAKIILNSSTSGELVRENCQDQAPMAIGPSDFQINTSNSDQLMYGGVDYLAQVPAGAILVDISAVFLSAEGGYNYQVMQYFGTPADSLQNLTLSQLQLYENGIPIGPAHSYHLDIATYGMGRFNYWTDSGQYALYFSSSDNTDPRSNGRVYSARPGP
jgi:hypothetical protein